MGDAPYCSTWHIAESERMRGRALSIRNLFPFVVLLITALPWRFDPAQTAHAMGRSPNLPDKIRVLIVKSGRHVPVKHESTVMLVNPDTRQSITRAGWLDAHLTCENGTIKVGGLRTGLRSVLIVPQNSRAFLSVEGNRYRGAIRATAVDTSSLSVINELKLDEFLYGMVGREIPASWPAAALEAQAIAARSFAVDRIRMNAKKAYDILANVTLAYGGVGAETPAVRTAVNRTQGKVLFYKGAVLPAYFSSTCGGHTEEVGAIYPETGAFPRAVRCNWCRDARFFQWEAGYSWREVEAAMQRMGAARGAVRSLRVSSKTSTGRAAQIEVISDAGRKQITAHQFRSALGVDKLRSTWFSMQVTGGRLQVKGRGWGHGIGLCQNGAGNLAKQGWSAKNILQRYYPGAVIRGL